MPSCEVVAVFRTSTSGHFERERQQRQSCRSQGLQCSGIHRAREIRQTFPRSPIQPRIQNNIQVIGKVYACPNRYLQSLPPPVVTSRPGSTPASIVPRISFRSESWLKPGVKQSSAIAPQPRPVRHGSQSNKPSTQLLTAKAGVPGFQPKGQTQTRQREGSCKVLTY
jgi:hypothetical protein